MSEKRKPARQLKLEVDIDASPEAVWQALTEGEQIANWFAPEAASSGTGVGGEVTFGWSPEMRWTTKVDAWEPGKRVRWLDSPSFMGEGTAMATDWLIETAGGKTRLTLVQSGFGGGEGTWDDLFDGTEVGWTYFLHHLRVYLEKMPGRQRHMIASRFAVNRPRTSAWQALLSPRGGLLRAASAGLPGDTVQLAIADPPLRAIVDIAIPGHALALRMPEHDALLFLELEGKNEPFHLGAWLSVHDERHAGGMKASALEAFERVRAALA
ncbi:MAG TPA: SRPBCC domain-containing protein [Usitatibacter sp.]|nr:SRPBCC domain-containing protein [Usitatibacter sp.]